ncbi:MAG: hypothetical protein AMXMBFR49_29020 [Chlorobiota bacterium]
MASDLQIDAECVEWSNDSNIKVKENKSSYNLVNDLKLKIGKVHVDGCLVKYGKRCDYLYTIPAKSCHILIELKGTDFSSAIDQITNTLALFKGRLEGVFHGRIVLSRSPSPDLRPISYRNLRDKLLKEKGSLEYGTIFYEEKLSTICK